MQIKKWLMKQQWRLTQIRGIWGLFYGILLLAIAFVEFIPIINTMGAIAPFILAGLLLIAFLILGYIYDRVLIMWASSQEVSMERNPYQYVPQPRDRVFWFPFYSVLLEISEEMANKYNIETSLIDEVREYYAEFEKLTAERKEDIDTASELRDSFMKKHSFNELLEETSK